VIQFFHPQKNISKGTQANYIGNKYNVPDDVKHILAKACNDCHSNNTRYPWYSKIQPVDWWLHKHIVEGKKGLNFDEYTDKRLRYQTSLVANQQPGIYGQDLLSSFTMSFDQPLRTFDSSRIRLYTDSTFSDPGPYSFRLDSSRTIITLTNTWKENTSYHIILDKDFAEDSAGKKLLKTDTLSFRTKRSTDYGSLTLRLKNIDMSKNPVLLIVQGETIYKSFVLTAPAVTQNMFLPGEYELRILYDNNKNGHWDPGEFFGKHKQPEIVRPIERKISVKPAFVNEFDISL
jgi:hypothetical protein